VLRLDDYYVWDSWIADDGDLYHLYFLQAPRSLGDPGPRHVNATIGHATSKDLVNWDYLGTSFAPSEIGRMAFDDMAVWTGSVINDGQQWWMFYTAISHSGHHLFDQRIGAAISTDLHTGSGSPMSRQFSRTRAGTRRWPSSRRLLRVRTSNAAAKPGATPWFSPTPTATVGTC
jgi:hypothetical protein